MGHILPKAITKVSFPQHKNARKTNKTKQVYMHVYAWVHVLVCVHAYGDLS